MPTAIPTSAHGPPPPPALHEYTALVFPPAGARLPVVTPVAVDVALYCAPLDSLSATATIVSATRPGDTRPSVAPFPADACLRTDSCGGPEEGGLPLVRLTSLRPCVLPLHRLTMLGFLASCPADLFARDVAYVRTFLLPELLHPGYLLSPSMLRLYLRRVALSCSSSLDRADVDRIDRSAGDFFESVTAAWHHHTGAVVGASLQPQQHQRLAPGGRGSSSTTSTWSGASGGGGLPRVRLFVPPRSDVAMAWLSQVPVDGADEVLAQAAEDNPAARLHSTTLRDVCRALVRSPVAFAAAAVVLPTGANQPTEAPYNGAQEEGALVKAWMLGPAHTARLLELALREGRARATAVVTAVTVNTSTASTGSGRTRLSALGTESQPAGAGTTATAAATVTPSTKRKADLKSELAAVALAAHERRRPPVHLLAPRHVLALLSASEQALLDPVTWKVGGADDAQQEYDGGVRRTGPQQREPRTGDAGSVALGSVLTLAGTSGSVRRPGSILGMVPEEASVLAAFERRHGRLPATAADDGRIVHPDHTTFNLFQFDGPDAFSLVSGEGPMDATAKFFSNGLPQDRRADDDQCRAKAALCGVGRDGLPPRAMKQDGRAVASEAFTYFRNLQKNRPVCSVVRTVPTERPAPRPPGRPSLSLALGKRRRVPPPEAPDMNSGRSSARRPPRTEDATV